MNRQEQLSQVIESNRGKTPEDMVERMHIIILKRGGDTQCLFRSPKIEQTVHVLKNLNDFKQETIELSKDMVEKEIDHLKTALETVSKYVETEIKELRTLLYSGNKFNAWMRGKLAIMANEIKVDEGLKR